MRAVLVVGLLLLPAVAAAAGPAANVVYGSPLVWWRVDGREIVCNVEVAHEYVVSPDRGYRLATVYGAARPAPFATSLADPAACARLDMSDFSRVQRGYRDPWNGSVARFAFAGECGDAPCTIFTEVRGRGLDVESTFEERIYLGASPSAASLVVTSLHLERVPVPG